MTRVDFSTSQTSISVRNQPGTSVDLGDITINEKLSESKFYSNEKVDSRTAKIIRFTLLGVLVLLLISLITAASILLAVATRSNQLENMIESVCGSGHCYILDYNKFDALTGMRYKNIIKYLDVLKSSGVGAILLKDVFSEDLTIPSFSAEIKTLAEVVKSKRILLYVFGGDLGSISMNHLWVNESTFYSPSLHGNKYILDYSNEGMKNAVKQILQAYGRTDIDGFVFDGLPLNLDESRNTTGEINLAAIRELKLFYKEEFMRPLNIILSATPHIPYPQSFNGSGISGVMLPVIEETIFNPSMVGYFLTTNINASAFLPLPDGPEKLWTTPQIGFSQFYKNSDVEYKSVLTFCAFLPGSYVLTMGDEYKIELTTSFTSTVDSFTLNSTRYAISNHTNILAELKSSYFQNYEEIKVSNDSSHKEILSVTRSRSSSTKQDYLFLFWNRDSSLSLSQNIQTLASQRFEVIDIFNGKLLQEPFIILEPKNSTIIRIIQR